VLLFASYSGALGGAERLLLDWASGFDDDVFLACPEGPLSAAARAAGIRVFSLHNRSPELRGSFRDRVLSGWRIGAHGRELRALVRNLDPCVLVLWGMRAGLGWLVVGDRAGGPRATVLHHNDLLPGPRIGRLVRAAAARADLVTAPSHAVARDLDPDGRLGRRLNVVHPGVDVARFDSAAGPAQPPEVIVLGGLVGWKRPEFALEVCARARQRVPELRLRFVGAPIGAAGPGLMAALRTRAAEPDLAGAVEFAGPVLDPAPELARAACLLHCADGEPFGLAVLEAVAAGRPVVVPAAGGPAEIVDQECGLLYPPGDVAAAADAVVRLVSDPTLAARMGAAGRARARERFDLGASRARWVQAVMSVRPDGAHAAETPTSLEVVTVTHNSAAVIGDLLSSVERHLPGVGVLVVDCASSDETVRIAARSPVARMIELDQNVGFGRACNRAMADVGTPVTALLNPDVELLDSSLLDVGAEATAGAAERILAPLVLTDRGRPQDSVHPVPGSTAELARTLVPYTLLPQRLAGQVAPWRASAPRRVGWALGCALVARTETLRRLGPFDERIFLYGEDLDLGLRAAEAGVETWFWPTARVLHHGAHATRAAFDGEAFALLARGRRGVLARHLGRRGVAVDDAAQALTYATRLVAKRALRRGASRERQQLDALRAVRRDQR
jgi:N-acetylglucosaminyl-diphospho-decaprenol L-rhamnosyltransferase